MSIAKVEYFEADSPVHVERVETFRAEVRQLVGKAAFTDTLPLIRRYITTGQPVGITPDTYHDLWHQIADGLDLHPNAVVVVGSSRTGFSICQKEFKPRYRPFSGDSDVDVAVVDQNLFLGCWAELHRAVYRWRTWVLDESEHRPVYGKRKVSQRTIGQDVFSGCLNPASLPLALSLIHADRWFTVFNEATNKRICDRLPIRGRLYVSWERLELYQHHMIQECASEEASRTKA